MGCQAVPDPLTARTPSRQSGEAENSLKALQRYGQSVWLDYIRRSLIVSGELEQLIETDGLRWVTSNPVISTALVGCRSVAEVEDNVGALGWSVDAADLDEVDTIFARHGVDTVPDFWIEDD